MPSDEYTAFSGGGILKLKGAKVTKKKKRNKASKSTISDNKAVSAALDALVNVESGEKANKLPKRKVESPQALSEDEEEGGKKKTKKNEEEEEEKEKEGEEEEPPLFRTEAEKRHEEVMMRRLQGLAADKFGNRPGLLKPHKERVEELNLYLSRLSEHHDMPKIGPG